MISESSTKGFPSTNTVTDTLSSSSMKDDAIDDKDNYINELKNQLAQTETNALKKKEEEETMKKQQEYIKKELCEQRKAVDSMQKKKKEKEKEMQEELEELREYKRKGWW